MSVVTLVLICAACSLLLNVMLKRAQLESVIGYILTGIGVGYAFQLQQSHSLAMIAEFGIVFLMFTIGLEFSPARLKALKKEVFLYGPLQMFLTALPFFAIGHWMVGLTLKVNLIVSLALSLSSTAIVLNLLTRSRKISHRYGSISVGVLLFQDIAVIPLLLMVSIFASGEQNLQALMLDVALDGAVVFVLLFFGGRVLTPHVMAHVIGTRSSELFVVAVLVFVVGAAELAHGLGFSYSLGAFLAGMVLSETPYKHQVEADLSPFRDLLLGVFFITVGMQVDPLFVVDNLPMILGIVVALLFVKALVLFAFLRLFNTSHTSVKSALLLAQCGEFSFVVFETAQANNLFVDPQRGQLLVMAIVLTMMLTPFVFRHLDSIVDRILPTPATPPQEEDEPEVESSKAGAVVICGFGVLGQRVAELLAESGQAYVGVEFDRSTYMAAREKGLPVYYGNAASAQLLEKVHAAQAPVIVLAMNNAQRMELAVDGLSRVAPDVPVVAFATSKKQHKVMQELGVIDPVDGVEQMADALVLRAIKLVVSQGDAIQLADQGVDGQAHEAENRA